MLEIEYTAIVPNVTELFRRAGPVETLWRGATIDTYYDRDDELAKHGRSFRLRRKITEQQGLFEEWEQVEAELTYKGTKHTGPTGAKQRQELTHEMTSSSVAINQLEQLLCMATGFCQVRRVVRSVEVYAFPDLRNITFRLEQYHTMYDLLELEVHGAEEKDVQEAMRRLGLEFSDRNLLSYVEEFERVTGQMAVVN